MTMTTTTIDEQLRARAWRAVRTHLETTLDYARGGYAVAIFRDIEDRVVGDDLQTTVVALRRTRDAKKALRYLRKLHKQSGYTFMKFYHMELCEDFMRRIDEARAADGLTTY